MSQPNLIRNPGFEEGVTTPVYWQTSLYQPAGPIDADFIWDTVDYHSGSRSGKVVVRTIPGGSAGWIQYIDKATMLPGASYRLSAFYKSDGEGNLEVYFLDINGGYIAGFFKYFGPSLDWKETGVLEFTAPTRADWDRVAYIVVGMELAKVGFLSIDDYELYPAPPATYDLTIMPAVGGTTDPAPGTYTYPEGTSVTVTAIPSSGYTFDHWELDGVNVGASNPITVTMDKDHNLNGVFSAIPPGKGVLECHAYVDTTEVKASVEVVGVGTYTTPFTLNLAAGTYTLNAKYDTQTQTKTATITEGVTTRVDFTFAKAPVPLTGPLGIWTFPLTTWLGTIFPNVKTRAEKILTNIKERWKKVS
jgi:hypothetical protein